ncbi:peptidase U35 [Paenibacillus selenitireducens]|uniref:Peptidase U35 n=1 Tax=Paenibacillus selenitireducens TaxID=1324314 RepID=A0A1T2XCU3_9BACL|nr:HK97 family phage prohead protease [Paenibacillus selenitireducens]OPA77506.1 peptidase U35 [Paenibacillus selenitireducens]
MRTIKKEIRYLTIQQLETRSTSEGSDSITIVGYAAKFNTRSRLLYGEFFEKIAQGAFTLTLREDTIKALWNHNSDMVLGSTKSGTLRLYEDQIGLRMEIDLPNSTWGHDAYESVNRGDVDGVSFGMYVRRDSVVYLPDEDVYERTLLDIELFEVSPTAFPAYEDSEVETESRTLEDLGIVPKEIRNLAELEQLLIQIELMGV